jgi:hypothetical protein
MKDLVANGMHYRSVDFLLKAVELVIEARLIPFLSPFSDAFLILCFLLSVQTSAEMDLCTGILYQNEIRAHPLRVSTGLSFSTSLFARCRLADLSRFLSRSRILSNTPNT